MPGQISFSTIPQNLRPPLFYAEFSTVKNANNQFNQMSLLIGQTVNPQPAAVTPVSSVALAQQLFGRGSQLALMVAAYRAIDLVGELWVLPLADDGAAAKAVGSFLLGGAPTAAGTLACYVNGTAVPVPVTAAESLASIA